MEDWIDLIQSFPIHFDSTANSCSRIDRSWICGPSSLLIKLCVLSVVLSSPEEYFGDGFSDHAPLILSFGKLAPKYSSSCSTRNFICKSPEFSAGVNSLVCACELFEQPVHKQLELDKIWMKEAARRVKLNSMVNSGGGMKTQRLVLAIISRAIWLNDVGIANDILNTSAIAKDLLIIVGRRGLCTDHVLFDELFNDAHQKLQQQ